MKMKITIKRNYGISLIYEAENILVDDDIEDRIYQKDENGKIDYSKPILRDVNTDILDQYCNVLEDLIYYREREFDSTKLIEQLIEKLPEKSVNDLLIKLNKNYDISEDN